MDGIIWGDDLPSRDPAIDIFRTPGRYADLLHGKGVLSVDTPDILDRAAEAVRLGNQEALTESHRAALFFAEYVLLAHDANHYRVLGLEGHATSGEIRERYHLLMRIFHPDRCGWLEIDGERLAARINLAHQTLRNPASRSAYDFALRQEREIRTGGVAGESAMLHGTYGRGAPRRSLAERVVGGLPPRVRRHFPQFVLGMFGMIGVLMVAAAYLSRPTEGAIGGRRTIAQNAAGDAQGKQGATGVEYRNLAMADLKGSRVVLHAEEASVAVSGGSSQIATTQGGLAAVPSAAPPGRTGTARAALPASAEAGQRASYAGITPEEGGSAGPDAVTSADPVSQVTVTESSGGVTAQATASSVLSMSHVEQVLAPEEARNTIRLFAEFYRAGDIERFMQMFSADARSVSGQRAEIRRDYEDLFRTTRVRQVDLADFNWSFDRLSAHGHGAYYIRVQRSGEPDEEVFAGSLRIDLVKNGDRVLITGLFHTPVK